MKHDPHPIQLVERDLDEVVPGSKGAKGILPARIKRPVVLAGPLLESLEAGNDRLGELLVEAAGTDGDTPLDPGAQAPETAGEIARGEPGPDGDHATPDVHTDGSRD